MLPEQSVCANILQQILQMSSAAPASITFKLGNKLKLSEMTLYSGF